MASRLAWASSLLIFALPVGATTLLTARAGQGHFVEYRIPTDLDPKQNGCHSLALDHSGVAWMTLPWQNLVISYDPRRAEFARYAMPTPRTEPDGIAVDARGDVWVGARAKGGFVKIDGQTHAVTEYPAAQGRMFNIAAVAGAGRVYATSHQTRTVNELDPVSGSFREWPIEKSEWPLGIAADLGGLWVAGLNGYGTSYGAGPGSLIHIDTASNDVEYFPLSTEAAESPFAY
jgi:streptogramin lyase